jgi:hypothetical protein
MALSAFPLQPTHAKLASDLYGLRNQLMDRELTSRRAIIDLERRLTLHLALLARMEVTDFSPTGHDPERFIYFATALQSEDEQRLIDACHEAFEQMTDESLDPQPVFDALTGYPPPTDLLVKLYHDVPKARAPLFALWRRRPVDLPAALVNQAELQSEDPLLQVEALAYAANHPGFGLEPFRACYEPLLSTDGGPSPDEHMLVAALWGGLIRRDPQAPKALEHAVERVQSPEINSRLLRLMALNAAPEHLPILQAAYESSSRFDPRWWALTGRTEVVPQLIEQLGRPAQAVATKEAWHLLTGLVLPERPVLALVDEQGERVEPTPDTASRLKQIPDTESARAWWENQRDTWGERRWIMGQPDEAAWLFQLCRDTTGQTADDLLDRLALKLGRPLGIQGRWGWQQLSLGALMSLEASITDRALETHPA